MTTDNTTPITSAVESDVDLALSDLPGDLPGGGVLPGGHSFVLEAVRLGAFLQNGATVEEAVAAFIGDDPVDLSRARAAIGVDADAEIPMTVETAVAFLLGFAD